VVLNVRARRIERTAASPMVAFLMSLAVWPLPAIATTLYAISIVARQIAEPYRGRADVARSRLMPTKPDA
jgi:hypothetical protein